MLEQCPHSTICLPATVSPRIVVVGAGFAGINLIKKLRDKPVQVVLLDKNNFHQFQPLLYQVAIAGLEPDSILSPIRKLFQGYKNLIYRMAEVIGIEPESNRIHTNIGWVRYDYLVIATGSVTNFYGLKNISLNSIGLKDIGDALDIRSWILQNLEEATITCNLKEKDALTNFVIVGGGPAGVELAGALAEYKQYLLHKDYPELATEWMKIFLIEAQDRLLPMMTKEASNHAKKVLKDLSVEVLLNTAVNNYNGSIVTLANGEKLPAKMLVWTAGVKGESPSGLENGLILKNGRINVDEYNRVTGYSNVFAIGDVAAMISDEYPSGHPMLAPVAIQQGNLLGENLIHLIQTGNFKRPFVYKDKGSMATIGKKNAVAEIGSRKWKGWIAWLLWSTVHLISIVGFRNKIMVGVNWLFHYLTYEKANRLIIRKFKPGSDNTNTSKLNVETNEMVN
ncbi:MAG: FAD-dependent oxidoreductase [Saprospirales bacterium]|nr:FAD-dependent oxidoreductase [Saprospirales bacterium]